MATMGKWERLITIPSGGWTLRVVESAGPLNVDISFTAADTYYWSSTGSEANDLAAEIAAKLGVKDYHAGVLPRLQATRTRTRAP